MSLDLVNNAIQSQSLSQENAIAVKIELWNYVKATYTGASARPDSSNIQNKLAQTLTFLFTILYASGWESFFRDLRDLAESDLQSSGQAQPGTIFYLRMLTSVHDEIADQNIQNTPEKSKSNNDLKDLIRVRDASDIALSWQQILASWQTMNLSVIQLCLNVISRWVSWTDINLIANDGVLQCLFQIAGQQDTGHPESGPSQARAASIGVFTEMVAKKMKPQEKVELIQFLNIEAVVSALVAAPILRNTSSPDYDTDMAETVAKLVNNVVLDVVNALNSTQLDDTTRATADRLLQSFTPHLLRFLADEYDEVCSTIMPALTEQLIFFRKISKASNGLQSPYKEMLPPVLDALIAKMRYDDSSSWGEEDEETDEAEFQELRKRLKVAQQNVAAIDETLYLDRLSRVVNATFQRCKQEGNQLNWRDLDVALLEMYMLGELAVKNAGLYQKKLPSSDGSQRLIDLMALMMDAGVPSFGHPTAQLQVMELCVRYYSFFEQRTEYLSPILEDFVRYVHSDSSRVRHRAWHLFLRFSRLLRSKLGELAHTIITAIRDLLAIRAIVPKEQEDGEDSSSASSRGPQDSTFESQLFLFEAIGTLVSGTGLAEDTQVNLLQPVLAQLLEGVKGTIDSAVRGDEQATCQIHHYIEAIGTLARGVSDWVPGKTPSPIPQPVAAEFQKAANLILQILNGLKRSSMIREASRFTFTRLIGVLGFTLLEQLAPWIEGLLSDDASREEIANFLRLLSQITYGFKGEIWNILDELLSPFLDKIFAAFGQPTEGTDDAVQLGELRHEYIQFLIVLLSNDLEGVLVSPTNQAKFDTIIATIEHFARDTAELSDARAAISVLSRMAQVWGGPNVFTPGPNRDISEASQPEPKLPGFDHFLIARFSSLSWNVMRNSGLHPREASAAKVVQEIATLQQTILTKTGAAYVDSLLQDKDLPAIGLGGDVLAQYLRSITTMDNKAFKQWLTKLLQQGPGG